jgi:Domain of unknown function (DUF4410)
MRIARGTTLALLLSVVALATVGCFGAQQTRPDDPVGFGGLKPSVEDKDAGLVGLAPGFDIKRYAVVAVQPFPVIDPNIKDEDDRKLATMMSSVLQAELVRHLRASGVFTRVVNLAETSMPTTNEQVLKLQGNIGRLGEGSQALRAFFGLYGAGRTRTQVEMAFVDARSGRVQLVTADRRIASMGMFGGDSKDHLKESYDDMARDLAKFLARLSHGEAPAAK